MLKKPHGVRGPKGPNNHGVVFTMPRPRNHVQQCNPSMADIGSHVYIVTGGATVKL
jgi:hypothetical protein